MFKNILFLENKQYLDSLGIFSKNINFDGINNYKIKDKDIERYDLIISQLYINPLSNFIIIKARKNNVKTLLLSDGIIEWSNCFNNPQIKRYNLKLFHPVIHDIFLCVGKEETKYFNFLGYNTMQYLPKRMAPQREKLAETNNNKFLITTANTAYYNEEERYFLTTLMQEIITKLDLLNIEYIFRIYDKELIKILQIKKEDNIIDGTFENCLAKVASVITTPSSISFTAMYHNRAVAHLIYRDTPIFIQAGWNLSLSINIENTLQNMIKKEQERIDFQTFQVSNYLADNDEVEKKIDDVIKKQKIKKQKIFINQNLYNLINSNFNFNLEYYFRKIYLKIKKLSFIQTIKRKIK